MESENIFTQKPFTQWEKQYSLYLSKGSAAYANKYPTPLSFFIRGLRAEFASNDFDTSHSFTSALNIYFEGSKRGDALCCLRLHEIYSTKDNKFQVITDQDKAWLYIILAQFYALCSPFGLEVDISPSFLDFIYAMGDDLKLQKSLYELEHSIDAPALKYKRLIIQIFSSYYDETISGEDNLERLRKIFETQAEKIDDLLIGAFLMNLFTGNYEEDVKVLENNKVHMYFNNRIIDIFRLYNVTFTVQGDTQAMMLTAMAVNVSHFLVWKGKNYKGEIDECLGELLRMCRFVTENNQKFSVSADALQIFRAILGVCYAKGFLVKQSWKKALEYYDEINPLRIEEINF